MLRSSSTLRGDTVFLRPIEKSDGTHFLKWFNDPEVIYYLDAHLPMSETAGDRWIEEVGTADAGGMDFMIEVLEGDGNKTIGAAGLREISPKDHNARFHIIIGEKDYWGRGCGSEATRAFINYGFQQLNLHRISSEVFSFNERSIRMHRTLGFTEEGHRREAIFKNGRFHDMVFLGVLKEEWQNLSAKPR